MNGSDVESYNIHVLGRKQVTLFKIDSSGMMRQQVAYFIACGQTGLVNWLDPKTFCKTVGPDTVVR